ncbi:hypothetical protein ASG01_05565 [Chryseobacterium sp. Leaf180]|jgi:hypothetical protein|uniref:hypothetical protein n=1 Tax=Chryseobacterium sp. Leaf180 TaxID=1736289 RepID=UPI0006FB6ED8|nr:hypothetical protein [Chryseobacterium sp. Leaf180]KQR95313.1 hypothetical protein ASG01_05565 [Chryseobacterium sp. Leaf180]
MTPKQNFYLNPTRTQYNLMLILYGAAILMLTASMTNIFEGAFINREFEIHLNPLIMLLIASSTGAILSISRNYRQKKGDQTTKPVHWMQNPSTSQWLLFSIIYLISFAAFILSITNLIEEDFTFRNFHVQNNLVYSFIWFFATVAVIRININYFRTRKNIS